jgi:alkanesulfonate monooxygenase SsuD/methylene tetrahydromethanopterin reductase-like flavin-dependent oxidoreductase (luciferase family)
MRFGVFLIAPGRYNPSPEAVYREVLSEVQLAEDLGFDSVWFAEHHFDPGFSLSPSPNLLAAAAAARTRGIRLGLAVNVLPLHHPLRLAEEGAMLDVLSGGRLIWGIGRGTSRKEFDPWTVPLAESRQRTLEAHDAVLRLWTEEEVSLEGRFTRIEGARLSPRPVQRPHPEVWTVATSPESVVWAAERGYPFMQVARPVDNMAESWRLYREHYLRVHGGAEVANAGLVPLHYVFLDADGRRARELAAPHMSEFWEHFSRIDGGRTDAAPAVPTYEFAAQNRALRSRMTYDDLIRTGIALIGDPDAVASQIASHASRLDLRYMLCDFWRAALGPEDRSRVMRLFAAEVMPRFR